ncbi:MAG: DEAD/DEAH box helicase [Bacteroidaceae bacterium]|nr:DEAD/DEAH box helicase [Bacteroidaceae bacterium]
MYFDQLPLDDRLLDALYEMRFDQCTPIQQQAIPPLLEGKDLMGISQTGTGKTAAYLLPLLNNLCANNQNEGVVKNLIIVPTRELAIQIDQAIEGFGYYLAVSGVAIYGGNDARRYTQELKSLKLGADIIVATPGRLISHLQLGNLDLSHISCLVLDEADRMLDMGFYDDIMKITSFLPKQHQTIMFSATMPPTIDRLAHTLLKQPVEIHISPSRPAEGICQEIYLCSDTQKQFVLNHIFQQNKPQRTIIFASSKSKVKDLTIKLHSKQTNVAAMHSDLSQEERNQTMQQFKAGNISIVVATDIISRGIDIDDIEMVINFDVPHDPEDYIHRVGRTARAGKSGRAITLVSQQDKRYLQKIEQIIGKKIKRGSLPPELTPPKTKNNKISSEKNENNKRNNKRRPFKGKPKHKKTQTET